MLMRQRSSRTSRGRAGRGFMLAALVAGAAIYVLAAMPAAATWLKALNLNDYASDSRLCFNNARCIAADDSGTVHVVWYDDRTGANEIYHITFNGRVWDSAEAITASGDYSAEPSVALDSLGFPHVVWCDWRDGNGEIYYKRFDGASWTADERLTDAERFSGHPAAAFDSSETLHVAWQDLRGYQQEIYYKQYDGISWSGEAVRITALAGSGFVHPCEIRLKRAGEIDIVALSVKVWGFECNQLAPGYHRVLWNGNDQSGQRVSPGLHFVEVEAAGRANTAKAVLLR